MMKVDRILFPIETLGPGNRLVIWTRGCSKHCHKCANPELWSSDGGQDISVKKIVQIIYNIHKDSVIDGITISGGDPLEQIQDLIELLDEIKLFIDDILVYTGFEYSLIEQQWEKTIIDKLRDNISVLIDGRYINELNKPEYALKGSANQNIIIFDEKYKEKYERYIRQGRKIQNVYMGNKLISVGIHNVNEEKI